MRLPSDSRRGTIGSTQLHALPYMEPCCSCTPCVSMHRTNWHHSWKHKKPKVILEPIVLIDDFSCFTGLFSKKSLGIIILGLYFLISNSFIIYIICVTWFSKNFKVEFRMLVHLFRESVFMAALLESYF